MMVKEISEKNGAFIRDIGAKLPRVVLFTDAQIKFFVDVCKRDIIYLDATGSVMKKSGEQKGFQIYTLLGRHPNEGGPALFVATSVTTCHDTRSIRNFLYIFLKVTTEVTGSKPKPLMIIIDGSMAMWNAVLLEFSNETRTKYYNRCWRIIMGKAEPGDLKQTFVLNCLSHAMRAAKSLVVKHYNKKFKKEAMYWICLLFNCTTFDELEKLMQSLFVLLNCEKNSKVVKQHFDKLQQKVHEQHDLRSWQEDEVESDDLEDADFLDPTIAIDKKQEISSNFYIHFNQQLNSFLSSQMFDAHQMFSADNQKYRNVYCNKEFCEKIVRIIISRICSTSKLMLGDLSRHYSKKNDKNMTRYKAFDSYSQMYHKLERSGFQTICKNNRTQGIMEQHFGILKSIYLQGKRITRLDEFIEHYHPHILSAQKEASNYAALHGNKRTACLTTKSSLEKSKPISRLVESKFRKGRKRRNRGYYATTLAQNSIKFVGLLTPENDITNVGAQKNDYPATGLSSQPNQSTNINVTPNKVISLSLENDIKNVSAQENDCPGTGLSSQPNQLTNVNVTPNKVISLSLENDIKNVSAQENDCPGTGLSSQPNQSTNINVTPNKKVILVSDKSFSNSDDLSRSKMKEFSFTLWNSLPNAEKKLTDHALALATKHEITWLDLLTLKASQSLQQVHEIKAFVPLYREGCLSKHLVDAYVAEIVKKANLRKGTEEYGSLDCDDFTIISKKMFKNKFVFGNKILDRRTKQLRENILIPFLLDYHFMLLWYCKETHSITLIDSLNQNHAHLMKAIVPVINLLKSFINQARRNEVTLESKCIVQQNDSISCGVCVCIAADLICKPKTSTTHETNVALTTAYISDYRFWIAYDLYNNSTWADHLLVEIENSATCWQAPRLPNLGNSCWFNATIQATAAVIKQANRFSTDFFDKTTTIKINESNDNNHLISLLQQILSKKNS